MKQKNSSTSKRVTIEELKKNYLKAVGNKKLNDEELETIINVINNPKEIDKNIVKSLVLRGLMKENFPMKNELTVKGLEVYLYASAKKNNSKYLDLELSR